MDFYKFNDRSLPELKQCLTMTRDRNARNKWLKEFRQPYDEYRIESIQNLINISSVVRPIPSENSPKQIYKEAVDDAHIGFYAQIESDPILAFDYMMEECTKNRLLFKVLAENLKGLTVDKICNHMFNLENPNILQIQCFYRYFFPVYFKQNHSWFSIDLLIKAQKAYPEPFKMLLQVLIQDVDLPQNILKDYVGHLDETGKNEFVMIATELELSKEEFAHNLVTIYLAYKDSSKSEEIQSNVFKCLDQFGQHCQTNRDYGRLLYDLLFKVKCSPLPVTLDLNTFEKMIETHRSPFKGPCMTMLKNIKEKIHEEQPPPVNPL